MELKNGFKDTIMGKIPSDWEIVPISDCAEVLGGGTPSTFIKEYWDGEINWFTPTEIGKNKYSYESLRKITESGLKNSSAKVLPIGTILLTSRASIGDMSILKNEASTNQGFQSLLANTEIDNEFLYYAVRSQKKQLLQQASGSTFLEISPAKVKSALIPLPPTKAEQNTIATALSDMDNLIAGLEQLIAKKKAIKQGAMQELLRPKEGWVVKKLGEIGEFKNGINKSAESFGYGFPFVNLLDVFGVSKISSNDHLELINSSDAERKLYDMRKGDVLFIRSSVKPEGVGLPCLIEQDLKNTVFSGFIIRFRDFGFLDDQFKQYCFLSSEFRNKVIASSSVSANTNINQEALKQIEIAFPSSKSDQNEIGNILAAIENELTSLGHNLSKYKLLKQGMMQELLTGKTRLV